ncbi:hypothetical protein [uncultured Desulfobacter sp.]|nr:hypothetical protein [uncultured Desulfobacter sp.]
MSIINYKHIPAPQNGKGREKAFPINMDGEKIVMAQEGDSE